MLKVNHYHLLTISWAVFSFVLAFLILRGIVWEPGLPYTRDLIFPYNLPFTLDHQLSTWNDIHSQRTLEINKIPIYWIFKIGSTLVGSENFVKAFFILVLFSLSFFIFVSLLIVFKRKVKSIYKLALICGIPSLFYLFNPWVVDRISNHIFMVFGMALTPILIIMYIRMLEKAGSLFQYLLVAALLTFISMVSSHNIYYIVPILVFSGLFYTIFATNKRKVLLDNIYFFIIYFLLNIYWILPVGYEFAQASIGPSYGSLDIEDIEKLSKFNTPSNLLRFIGGGAWDPVLQYPPQATLSIYMSFLTIFFSLFAIFLFPRNIFVLLLGVLICMFFILSLGTNSPFPIYQWLSTTAFSGILWLYRDPSRLIQYIVIACSFLLAFTVYRFTSLTDARFKTVGSILPYVIMASILVSPAMFTFLNEGGGRLVSQQIPLDYKKVYDFFSKDNSDYKVLWLPLREYFSYDWNNIPDVAGNFYAISSPKPTYSLLTESSANNTMMLQYIINDLLLENRTDDIGLYLRLYQIKYVVVHTDLEGPFLNEAEKTLEILRSQKDMKLLKQEGPYYIFQNLNFGNNEKKFFMLNLRELTSILPSNKTLYRSEILNKWIDILNQSLPLKFNKEGSTKFTLRINSTNESILGFAEPFDPLWVIRYPDNHGNKEHQSKPLFTSINGYYINRTTGDEIEVVHKPAELHVIGQIISIGTLLATVGFLLWKHSDLYRDKLRIWKNKRLIR